MADDMIRRTIGQTAAEGDKLLRRTPWGPVVALIVAIGLNLGLPSRLTLLPDWILPVLEALLIIVLLVGTTGHNRFDDKVVRPLMITTIAIICAANAVSLGFLVHYLLRGTEAVDGYALVLSALAIWGTNVIVFGLWYWELDNRGPAWRRANPDQVDGFLFPQMQDPAHRPDGWRPLFTDYLYVSFTNSTAFSPTDSMPLTRWAKWLMGSQALASLVTIALVAARAVNILN